MRMKNSQQGFTLIEILVALAVTMVLLTGVAFAVVQTSRITTKSSPQVAALEDIKMVAYSIGKDVKMAATADLTNPSYKLALTWTSWDYNPVTKQYATAPTPHSANYTLSGGFVKRYYDSTSVNATVGRHISNLQFSQAGNIITANITSSPVLGTQKPETRTYQFYLNPKEGLYQ